MAAAALSFSNSGLIPTEVGAQERPATIHFLAPNPGEVLLLDGAKLGSMWGRTQQSKSISAGSHVLTTSVLEGTNSGALTRIKRAGPLSVVFDAVPGQDYIVVKREGRPEAGGGTEWEPQVRTWPDARAGRRDAYLARTEVVSRPVTPMTSEPARFADLRAATSGPVQAAAHVLRGPTVPLYAVAVSPDGRLLAAGGGDGAVTLWSLPEGKVLGTLLKGLINLNALAFAPDGRTLAAGYFGALSYEVKLVSVPDGALLKSLKGFHSGVTSVVISNDGKLLAAGSIDEAVRLFSLPDGELLGEWEEKGSAGARAVAFTPDGKILAAGYEDGTVRLWSVPDGRLVATAKEHRSGIRGLAVSPDGKSLASGAMDSTVRVWSLPDGRLQKTLEGHQRGVNAVAITPDGGTIISASSDYSIRFWSLADGTPRTTWVIGSRPDAMVVSSDGKSLVCGLWDDSVRLWPLP
jgi:sugar lactone lactonase YvrE